MTRTEIIQALIDKHGYTSYLEIGVQSGQNFFSINCKTKVGVDPDRSSKATIYQTSDLFFSLNTEKFDLIFIDGLHISEQVEKDILNAMQCLSLGGTIVCHDMNPVTEKMQRVPRVAKQWTGDCWKAWVNLRSKIHGWDFYVIDTDFGVGVITRDAFSKPTIKPNVLNYFALADNRVRWLNLISVDDFRTIYLDEHRTAATG